MQALVATYDSLEIMPQSLALVDKEPPNFWIFVPGREETECIRIATEEEFVATPEDKRWFGTQEEALSYLKVCIFEEQLRNKLPQKDE